MAQVPADQPIVQDTYDEIPYPGNAYAQTHPSHIAAVAQFCGLSPARPSACRVLELGCAEGANLLPMAEQLPGSEFVGVDRTGQQVERARHRAEQAGLENVDFRHAEIMDVDESFGQFDYILCHGVYSWVPESVRRRILQIGQQRLNDDGLMYVSYNVYPGWHMREAIRNMMKMHCRAVPSPAEKVGQARQLLKFLIDSSKSGSEAYGKLLEEEAHRLEKTDDSYLFHEHLEATNEPCYFYEFLEAAGEAELKYIADTSLQMMVVQHFGKPVTDLLADVPLLQREQYMDFLRGRMFRASLVARATTSPRYDGSPDRLRGLSVVLAEPMRTEPSEDASRPPGEITWRCESGRVKTSPELAPVVERLNERWPRWTTPEELVSSLGQDQGEPVASESTVYRLLLSMLLHGALKIAVEPPSILERGVDNPATTPLMRIQAAAGTKVTNRAHIDIDLPPLARFLARQLDGTATVQEVTERVVDAVHKGELGLSRRGEPVTQLPLDTAKQLVASELAMLAANRMLVDPPALQGD